jgi:hypothetical protein
MSNVNVDINGFSIPEVGAAIAKAAGFAKVHRSIHAAVLELYSQLEFTNPNKFGIVSVALRTYHAAAGTSPMPVGLKALFGLTDADLKAVVLPRMLSISRPQLSGKKLDRAAVAKAYADAKPGTVPLELCNRAARRMLVKQYRMSKVTAGADDGEAQLKLDTFNSKPAFGAPGPMRDGTYMKWYVGEFKGQFPKTGLIPAKA